MRFSPLSLWRKRIGGVDERGCGNSPVDTLRGAPIVITALWIAVALLATATTVLFLVVTALAKAIVTRPTGESTALGKLRPGAIAPEFSGASRRGGRFDSRSLRGEPYLLLFAHPGCKPCDDLIRSVGPGLAENRLRRLVLVSQLDSRGGLQDWDTVLPPDSRAMHLVLEDGADVSDLYSVSIRPYAFAVDAGGTIVRAFVPSDIDDLLDSPSGSAAGADATRERAR